MASASSSGLDAGSFLDKKFMHKDTPYRFRVIDGNTVAREAVQPVNLGDIWFAEPQPGEIHNIWVYGSLTGTEKIIRKRTLVSQWTRVPQDASSAEKDHRVHFPTNEQIDGGRMLHWGTVSLRGLDWASRAEVSAFGEFPFIIIYYLFLSLF